MQANRLYAMLLIAPLALAACGAPDEGGEAMGGMEEAAEPTGEEPTGEMEPVSEPAEFTVTLDAMSESGVTGTVHGTHAGESVVVDVEVTGVAEGEELPAHVHQGTCATGGSVLVPLTSIRITEGGGSSQTTVAADAVLEGQSAFIQVHGPDGQPVACADLPGHGEM